MGSTDSADSDQPPSPDPDDHHSSAHAVAVAVVLAAGRGTRMRSRLPKVLHAVAGRPMLGHVLHALWAGGVGRAVVVTGYGEAQVRAAAESSAPEGLALEFVHQDEARGTGHSALQARAAVARGPLLIVNGDLALLSAEDVRAVCAAPSAEIALAVSRVPDPSGLGRVRREGERLIGVVEEADADAETAAIDEVNAGLYRAEAPWLWTTLESLPASASGEIYLTDVVARAAAAGGAVAVTVEASDGPLSVESRHDLVGAERALRRRITERWLDAGVTIVDPGSTYIDADVVIGEDCRIEPGSHLRGRTVLGRENVVGPNAVLQDTRSGAGCVLRQCAATGAVLGDGVEVGPFSTLREGAVLDDDVYIGTHAEVKESHLHRGVMMGHFSYVGDAEVGAESNVGAGAITCNFDGREKQRTVIGERVFIGSDTLLIAPVTLGDDSATGAGAVVNRDVSAGARVVGHPARAGRRGGGGAAAEEPTAVQP